MATCPYCGSTVSYSAKFCQNCGAPLPELPVEQTEPAPYVPVEYPADHETQAAHCQFTPPVTPVSTGGLLAWSILTLLLCTIPGIVAIIQTSKINKASTAEEQQAKIKSARTWCIVGTVLGLLYLTGMLANG